MRRNLAIAAMALAACAPAPAGDELNVERPPREWAEWIDFSRKPPVDWPALEVRVHDVSREQLGRSCPIAAHSYGCASLDFCARSCTIFLLNGMDAIRRGQVMDHERAHCQGYDHPGSSTMRDGWTSAKAIGCGR